MIDVTEISIRHLLPADGLDDGHDYTGQRIRIVLSDVWANSRAGQLIASCLVNLLCRQTGLIKSIEVCSPNAASLVRLPSGSSDQEFPRCLGGLVKWAVDEAVVFNTENIGPADHTIVIGAVDLPDNGTLFVIGSGWRAWVGTPDNAPKLVTPDSGSPLGPFLAAALAAGEVFKAGRGINRGKMLSQAGYSLWTGTSSAVWEDLRDGPSCAGSELSPFHLVGAGAVGNDLAYIIANLELSDGYVVVIDDDRYDETNLNRCLLAGCRDVTHPKVGPVGGALENAGIGAYAFAGTIRDYVSNRRDGLRADMARQANDLNFDVVVSAVDRGLSRQHIQGLAPGLLLGASTLNLTAKANYYPNRPGAACLGCFNPAEREGEKIRALERRLRAMAPPERSQFSAQNGIDPSSVEAWLASGQCGTLGEAAIQELALRGPPEFSVGFVSLGAALLAASMLLRLTMFPDTIKRLDMNVLNFLNGGMMDSALATDDHCEWGCQSKRSPAQ